jgi:hypothetical protein
MLESPAQGALRAQTETFQDEAATDFIPSEMVPQRHLPRIAPHHLPESLGGGIDVPRGGIQGGMAEQGLQLDHVSTGLHVGGAEREPRHRTLAWDVVLRRAY